jgi:non-homologous end joining protein Ku
MAMIEEKAQKRAPSEAPLAPRPASNIVDMVAVLQESLRKAEADRKTAKAGKTVAGAPPKQRRKVAA